MWDLECATCGKSFPAGSAARENHCRSTGHVAELFECETCPKQFRTDTACDQHMDATRHWKYQAQFSYEKYQCNTCTRTFTSQAACEQHMNALSHWEDEPYECNCCYKTWSTEEKRRDHEVAEHHYCAHCDRYFQNYNNIKMHLNSRTHRGQQIACPFCKDNFTTATGVAHHLESGGCSRARGMNRDEIYRAVRSSDPSGLISKNLIGWHGSDEYEASEYSWNGYAYECYFCDREFNKLQSLNQHLNSPIHQQDLYHCPNRSCRIDFKSLAAIINHLESESCGFMCFQSVQNKMGDLISGNRRIAF